MFLDYDAFWFYIDVNDEYKKEFVTKAICQLFSIFGIYFCIRILDSLRLNLKEKFNEAEQNVIRSRLISIFQSSFCRYSDCIVKKSKNGSVTNLVIKVDAHLWLNAFHVTTLSFTDSARVEFKNNHNLCRFISTRAYEISIIQYFYERIYRLIGTILGMCIYVSLSLALSLSLFL